MRPEKLNLAQADLSTGNRKLFLVGELGTRRRFLASVPGSPLGVLRNSSPITQLTFSGSSLTFSAPISPLCLSRR